MSETPDISRAALHIFKGELARSRQTLVPEAHQILWEHRRYTVLYGGRDSAKSWSIGRVELIEGYERPLRMLCCREIMGSLRESAYRLLADQVHVLGLDDFYDVQADTLVGRNGSRFYFEGLKYNANKIRSYEGVDVVWVEEAQNVSELSWETLLPTIRKAGSRFFISFNPMQESDPVYQRFVKNPPPGCLAKKVTWRDNPYHSEESEAERLWLERTDRDAHDHVWEGGFRTVSDALILRGKYVAEEFEVSPAWAGPYHGLDYGFSRDPSAAVRCYIDDQTRTLFVDREFWQLGADIDALPNALEAAVPGISRHVVYADAARPESTSYISRNGIPNARSVEKWSGSVDDGVAYLRAFARIVIHPRCTHLLDECARYSFKQDRLTGAPLPEVLDAHNHCIDALRYALSPLIRNQPNSGHFNRAALLVDGEPVEFQGRHERAEAVFATVANCDRPGSGVGVIFWAVSPVLGPFLRLLDYSLVEVGEALSTDCRWLEHLVTRLRELQVEWDACEAITQVYVEEGELLDALAPHFQNFAINRDIDRGINPPYDMTRVEGSELQTAEGAPLTTLDQRAMDLRSNVNGGSYVKLARSAYLAQTTFRSTTANHLTGQLLAYRAGAKDAPQELVAAFVLGALFMRPRLQRRPALELPALTLIEEPRPRRERRGFRPGIF